MWRSLASRITRVAKVSRRNEKPTPASASITLTPGSISWAFQVRMVVSQGTNSG